MHFDLGVGEQPRLVGLVGAQFTAAVDKMDPGGKIGQEQRFLDCGVAAADKTNQARLFANPKVEMHWHAEIADVLGSADPLTVTGVALRDTRDGSARELACDGLFIAIGHVPATELFARQLAMDDEGYLITSPDSTATSVAGVFAAGDVKDKVFRQAVTAAGMGCMAALEAERFLSVGAHAAAAA